MPTLAVRLTPGIEAAALEPSSICAFEVHRELWVSQIEVAYYDALHSPHLASISLRSSPATLRFSGLLGDGFHCRYAADVKLDRGSRVSNAATVPRSQTSV